VQTDRNEYYHIHVKTPHYSESHALLKVYKISDILETVQEGDIHYESKNKTLNSCL